MILSPQTIINHTNIAPELYVMESLNSGMQRGVMVLIIDYGTSCYDDDFATGFEEAMETALKPSLRMICWIALCSMFFPSLTNAQTNKDPILILISPVPGTTAVSKTPNISFKSSQLLVKDGRLILFDGNDISALISENNGLYSFTPPAPIAAGEHNIYVAAYTENGTMIEHEFFFSSRQSESFEEIYSDNRVSATLKTALRREFSAPEDTSSGSSSSNFAYTSFDSYLSSESAVKEGKWDTSLRANARYFDQNASLMEPEKKGLSLIDFLIAANYTEDNYSALIELGDTTIEESVNTIDYLTRRGGKVSLTNGNLTLNGFGVLGQETMYEIDGLGLGFNSTDHIMGTSLQADFFDQQMSIKAIYSRGGQEGDSLGSWTEDGARKGDVTGIVMTTDFFDQKLSTDFEFDAINYDRDTNDDSDDVSDNAYRIRIAGLTEVYDYDLAYKYSGPEYDVVGNQSIIKDWAGFEFNGGMNYPVHGLRLLANYSWDNVEDNTAFARIYSFTTGIDYQYSGWDLFPVSLYFEHNNQRSQDEPEPTDTTSLDTSTLIGSISFINGPWSIELRPSYSEQDDKTLNDYDSKLFTFSLMPTYTQTFFSILPSWTLNSSKDLSSDVRTDTNTLTLDIYTSLYQDTISCELGGTYDWTETDDDSVDMNSTSLYARLNYRFEQLWQLEDSTIALEYLYNRQEDKIYDSTTWEGILTLVISSTIPYSF